MASPNRMMRGKIVLFLQFLFIVLLVYALSIEYQSNQFQQSWVSANVPWLQYLLNGYMAAALIGILIGGAFLLVADIWRNRRRRGGLKTAI
jgi:TRAP-type C4-dicarboxylate transport system permease small subunit